MYIYQRHVFMYYFMCLKYTISKNVARAIIYWICTHCETHLNCIAGYEIEKVKNFVSKNAMLSAHVNKMTSLLLKISTSSASDLSSLGLLKCRKFLLAIFKSKEKGFNPKSFWKIENINIRAFCELLWGSTTSCMKNCDTLL